MPDTPRLMVVSNRLPVSLTHEGTDWKTERSAGGLATAMDPILRRTGGIWIGWSGIKEEPVPEVLEFLRREQSCYGVHLPAEIVEKFYEGYANEALWPLFHSFVSRLRFNSESWEAYIEANERFCSAVVEAFRPGDRIWIHDYHLMLLPGMLRERIPDATIGFFLHIPFPAWDIFSTLPRNDELIGGLLGADLISFHTHMYLQNFRQSLRRLLEMESTVDRLEIQGREIRLAALPIGIAPDEFLGHMDRLETKEQVDKLRAQYAGRKVIVAVDRLDYTKGLPERLRTFRRLLEMDPELIGKVILLQIAVPSRENIESYQELRSEVHELIAEINGEFGTPDWVPVVYVHHGLSRSELVAVYHFADVAWVSPLRDGMNLVAKEYAACHPDGNGVLVLSAFAGSAAEMGEALLINPFDEERTASAIKRALAMPEEEKHDRMLTLHARVVRNNVFRWGERFLRILGEAAIARRKSAPERPVLLPVADVVDSYAKAAKRLLLLDYDGTLVPIAKRPREAIPDADLRLVLKQLTSEPANTVIVISGRRAADLELWLGQVPRLGFAVEHGARWRLPGGTKWQGGCPAPEWKDKIRPILDHFVEQTPGSFIEEKECALVWHYRTAESEFGEWLATELVSMLEAMLAETELHVYRGKKVVEVRPIWANKGVFANELLTEYADAGFILGIGDDRTDEDMFAYLPAHAWSVHVGADSSKARYRVPDTSGVRELLYRLAEYKLKTTK
ncbi:MAG TPA: bifunctional alpha,alpha-trehalose-phosphate synthase (UDP-forming)/trehalose-phosphatase [Bryobacteraceae bacterium]|nr:bifunctional alpha,alpha-trehalose-phosphate synthase (UDP-forming)/trehalose-phosphatase [Bryobacteraceae bacterium]